MLNFSFLRNAAHVLRPWVQNHATALLQSAIGAAWDLDYSPWQGRLSSSLISFLEQVPAHDQPATLVFDLAGIQKRMDRLASAGRPYGCRFLLPVKALPVKPAFELAKSELSGFDISNVAEYMSLPDNLNGCHVSVTSPSFMPSRTADLTHKGNTLTIFVSNQCQFDRLENLDQPVDFGIRLESASLLDWRQRYRSGRFQTSRFGVSAHDRRLLERMVASHKHHFIGFHVHCGFGHNSCETYKQIAERCVSLSESLGAPLGSINLGGGLHTIPPEHIGSVFEMTRRVVPPSTMIYFEPGDHISTNCAAAISAVESWQASPGLPIYNLNISRACHLRWSYPHPITSCGAPADRTGWEEAVLAGPTCSENDIIGRFNLGTPGSGAYLKISDTIFLGGISGYSLAWNTAFNGIPPAKVTLLPGE